jgi:PRC-barrel domain protein
MRFSMLAVLAALALSGVAEAQRTPPPAATPRFITVDANALLISRLIGLDVSNATGRPAGKIADMAFEGGQLVAVVLSVGEVLGSGERYVALDPSSLSINYTEAENKWQATMNAEVDQLKSAPEFRYEGKWKR